MDPASFRTTIYRFLIILSISITTARIFGVENVFEPSLYEAYPKRVWPPNRPEKMPTFSSNDRSRWATIRALVENGTFVIGHRVVDEKSPTGYRDVGILFEDGFRSVDVMMNPETKEFFSTKPPLLTLLVTGEYWFLNKVFGWTIKTHRWEVVCTILVTFNVLPLLLFFIFFSRIVEEYGVTDWGRIFVFACACFGTFLTTFSVTLNNHIPGAVCAFFAVYPLLRGRATSPTSTNPFTPISLLASGFFAGLATCMELPAAALGAGIVGILILQERPIRSMLYFAPALLLPLVLLVYSNYLAIGEFNLGYSKFGSPWYEYPGSHWSKAKLATPEGIDFANEPKQVYGFHLLLGHHGLFSLTPILILGLIGLVLGIRFSKELFEFPSLMSSVFLGIVLVVLSFYIHGTNNYGGWTCGPRWLFWLNPLFLFAMIPITDSLGRNRIWQWFGYLLFGISVFSVVYPVTNPWRHPWIYQLCEYMGWIRY